MKSFLVMASVGFLGTACALPWDTKDSSSSSSSSGTSTTGGKSSGGSNTGFADGTDDTGTSTTENVSSEVSALCDKLAPPGCITACKRTGTCFKGEASEIAEITCESTYLTFINKTGSQEDLCSKSATDTAADKKIGAARKRIFMTSKTWSGDLKTAGKGTDGISGADNLCAQAVTAAELGGTWKALLATESSEATARITEAPGGWYNLSRSVRLFANLATFDFPLAEGRSLTDETGSLQVEYARIGSPTYTCSSWSASGTGGAGGAVPTKDKHFVEGTMDCYSATSIVCVEQ